MPRRDDEAADDWTQACSTLTRLLQRATLPDCDLARAILARAEALVAVADRHLASTRARNRASERFADLRARPEECLTPAERLDTPWPADLPEGV